MRAVPTTGKGQAMQTRRIGNETEAGRLARVLIELDRRELSALTCENQEDVGGRLTAIRERAEDAELFGTMRRARKLVA